MSSNSSASPAVAEKKEAKPARQAKRYICIKKCFVFGRLWVPKRNAAREKDCVLVTDQEVNPNLFVEISGNGPVLLPVKLDPIALSQMQRRKPDDFLT